MVRFSAWARGRPRGSIPEFTTAAPVSMTHVGNNVGGGTPLPIANEPIAASEAGISPRAPPLRNEGQPRHPSELAPDVAHRTIDEELIAEESNARVIASAHRFHQHLRYRHRPERARCHTQPKFVGFRKLGHFREMRRREGIVGNGRDAKREREPLRSQYRMGNLLGERASATRFEASQAASSTRRTKAARAKATGARDRTARPHLPPDELPRPGKPAGYWPFCNSATSARTSLAWRAGSTLG